MADKPKLRPRMIEGPTMLQIEWKSGGHSPLIGPFWSLKSADEGRRELRKAHKPRVKKIYTLRTVKLDTALSWTSD